MITDNANNTDNAWLCDHFPGPHGCGGGAWQHGCTLCGKQERQNAQPFVAPPPDPVPLDCPEPCQEAVKKASHEYNP